jgi:tetratricopeptide (TPR) repeat protein
MRWLQTEYIWKGIFLGLLLYVALHEPDWRTLAWVNLCILAGLVVGLGIATVRKISQGYRVGGRAFAFVLFLLLESPSLVYAGVLAGTAVGAVAFIPPAAVQPANAPDTAPAADAPAETPPPAPAPQPPWRELLLFVAGGAVLGSLFGSLRQVQRRPVRIGLSLALAAALVAGALALFGQFAEFGVKLPFDWVKPQFVPAIFAVQLLIGIPVFYVLTFAGRGEESEVEIGAMCAALGLGLWMLASDTTLLPHDLPALRTAGFLVPIAIYFFYSTRVLPGLRVFKHALRGLSYLRLGRFRPSLVSLRRALQLDPGNKLARETLWAVHRSIDFEHLPDDPELLSLIDLDLCLDRAATLLLNPGPSQAQLAEAHRLLDLVVKQRPAMAPRVQYWRAVAFTHARAYDRAAAELQAILDPSTYGPDDPQRRVVLLQAWQLALTLHEELRRRVGLPQLAHPGRRMEAIAAVERHLAANPEDRSMWNLKQLLYQDLSLAEYNAAAGGGDLVVPHFDHAYAQQLGLALINDPVRWQRGGEYLRIAARGTPSAGTSLFITIAQANQRAGNQEGAWHNYELAKRAGQSVGARNLPDEERQAYFTTVKLLAEHALARGDADAAIENLRLYTESERSGVETLRTLADLYERRGDPLAALRVTEQALAYNGRDKDLLARKDRYYYSVLPHDLRARVDSVRGGFDLGYCLRKARSLLDVKNADLEILDWAQHLVELTRIVQPDSVTARVLLARCRLRRGETGEAVALLEELRNPKPERFATEDDEDAWYLSCRLLGDLYLNELGRPEAAIACYTDFRKSSKSGADTAFKLGRAYEQLGDLARAKRYYEQVTTYDNHPLVYEARDALHRLQTQ